MRTKRTSAEVVFDDEPLTQDFKEVVGWFYAGVASNTGVEGTSGGDIFSGLIHDGLLGLRLSAPFEKYTRMMWVRMKLKLKSLGHSMEMLL